MLPSLAQFLVEGKTEDRDDLEGDIEDLSHEIKKHQNAIEFHGKRLESGKPYASDWEKHLPSADATHDADPDVGKLPSHAYGEIKGHALEAQNHVHELHKVYHSNMIGHHASELSYKQKQLEVMKQRLGVLSEAQSQGIAGRFMRRIKRQQQNLRLKNDSKRVATRNWNKAYRGKK